MDSKPPRRKVAILGASDKPDRYAYLLMKRLLAKGHEVFPVNPALQSIEGHPVWKDVQSLPKGVDVLSVYMRAERSEPLSDAILASGIPRVVFNPGAENEALEKRLENAGREAMEACSLVLLGMDHL
jgi:predicted CoA-binding protein